MCGTDIAAAQPEGGGQAGRGAARSDEHAHKPPSSACRTISRLGRGVYWGRIGASPPQTGRKDLTVGVCGHGRAPTQILGANRRGEVRLAPAKDEGCCRSLYLGPMFLGTH